MKKYHICTAELNAKWLKVRQAVEDNCHFQEELSATLPGPPQSYVITSWLEEWAGSYICAVSEGSLLCRPCRHDVTRVLPNPCYVPRWRKGKASRAAPRKKKQRSEKSLQTTSLCYSIAKSTLKTPLTFSKVEKNKHENFDFVHLLSFFFFLLSFSFIKHNSKTIRCVQILNIPNDCSADGDYSYMFWAVYELRLASYGLKTVSTRFAFSFVRFLAFHAIIVWAWHVWSGHTWTTERVRYMQARVQAATSLLRTNFV